MPYDNSANPVVMEYIIKMIEALLEKTAEYGKTSFEMSKLKALDKTSDVNSTVIHHTVFFFMSASFTLILSLVFPLFNNECFGNVLRGFFTVAGLYGIAGFIMHFFWHKWFYKMIRNYLIKMALR
jgi:hypothetical protein